ncbi:MAG TPA: hypothetical protein VM487_21085 [Phycisphaerae bacterium]|nr:hypothetical protein [Phycisphaerae bacterium]
MENVNRVGLLASQHPGAGPPGAASALDAVPNEAALLNINDAALADGSAVMVGAFGVPYVLDKTSGIMPQVGVAALAQSGGFARWIRQLVVNPRWLNQVAWEIDPVGGNDENDGSPGNGLLTLDELERRWGDGTVAVSANVQVLAGTVTTTTNTLRWRFGIANNNNVGFGGQRTLLYQGTITGYAPKTGTLPGTITDAGVGDFAPYVGVTILVGTSGIIAGRTAVIVNSAAPTTAQITEWSNAIGAVVEAVGGETFDVFALPQINADMIFEAPSSNLAGTGLIVANLLFAGNVYLANPAGGGLSFAYGGLTWITATNCVFVNSMKATGTGTATFISCSWNGSGTHISGPRLVFYGCGWASSALTNIVTGGAQFVVAAACVINAASGAAIVVSNGQVLLDEELMILDSPFFGIQIYAGSNMVLANDVGNVLSGSSASLIYAVVMAAGAKLYYPNSGTLAAVASIAWMGGDLELNGAVTAFAAIPAGGFVIAVEDIAISPTVQRGPSWPQP